MRSSPTLRGREMFEGPSDACTYLFSRSNHQTRDLRVTLANAFLRMMPIPHREDLAVDRELKPLARGRPVEVAPIHG